MLPNMSGLTLATNAKTELLEHVAQRGGGKTSCIKHTDKFKTKEDNNPEINCAIDGYLMYKTIEGAAMPSDYSGMQINLQVEGAPVALLPLLKRTRAAADRKNDFEIRHFEWIRDTFPIVCNRGAGLSPLSWDNYGKELAKITEWYFLDEAQKRGHLFLQLFDTPAYKGKMHMPGEGVFAGRYLYVALVCAVSGDGYGKHLMKVAEAACRALGCEGIALASLSNSAGFYYSLGFKFVSKLGGQPLDVSAWTELVQQLDGSIKTRLIPKRKANPYDTPRTRTRVDPSAIAPVPAAKREREAVEEAEAEAKAESETEERSVFTRVAKASRGWYDRITALSFFSN